MFPAADEERYITELAKYEESNPGYSAWSAAQSRASSWFGAPIAPPQPRQLYVRSWCAACPSWWGSKTECAEEKLNSGLLTL